MPQIRLDLREADGQLPAVCMCCGAPATVFKTKKMYFWPRWKLYFVLLHPFIFGLIALIFSKKARVKAPFCGLHQGHWRNRSLLIWGSGAFLGLISGAALAIIATSEFRHSGSEFACLSGAGLLVLWLIIVAIVHSTEIRPEVITKSEIVLKGVSEEFVQAVQEADRASIERISDQSWDDEDQVGVQKSHTTAVQEERPRRRDRPDSIKE